MARKTAVHRIEAARTAHAAVMTQVAEKAAARNAALLAGKDAAEIAKIDAGIATLQHAARTESDRIRLLDAEAAKEKQATAAKQQQAHIGRFAKLHADFVADAEEIEKLADQLLTATRRCIERRERALAGFSVRSSHANASARTIEGAAMSGEAVMAHLAFHFYKISARPLVGGMPGARTEPALPGAKCPRLEWQLTPERITGFADAIRTASAFAVATLKAEIGGSGEAAAVQATDQPRAHAITVAAIESSNGVRTAPPAPEPSHSLNGGAAAEAPQRTPEQNTLSELLQEANRLAADVTPEAEEKYQAIMAQIPAAEAAANASITK